MKCLVTGGAGFIGSNLVKKLIRKGNEVSVVDNLSTGNKKNLEEFNKKINFYHEDILNLDKLILLFKGIDIVYHLAAIPSVTRSLQNPKSSSEVNIQGTVNVLIAARDNKIKKVIYASSSSVYGDTKELPKKEIMTPNPKSPYALTKFTGEQYCQMFSKYFDLSTVCLRYFNVYGPKQNPYSEYAAVIPKFINAVIIGKNPIIYGDGEQTRDFTFVEDVVKANILAAKSKVQDGTVVNIACNKNISLNKLLTLINTILKKDIKPIYSKKRLGDVQDSLADISRAKKLLQYFPDYDLKSGLVKTITWVINSKN